MAFARVKAALVALVALVATPAWVVRPQAAHPAARLVAALKPVEVPQQAVPAAQAVRVPPTQAIALVV
jgi:hypothetical protein